MSYLILQAADGSTRMLGDAYGMEMAKKALGLPHQDKGCMITEADIDATDKAGE